MPTWRFRADVGAARSARDAVEHAARRLGVAEDAVGPVKLAVSEAVTNAVLHGYRDGTAGAVEVCLEADDAELRVSVLDAGVGLGPRSDSPGLGLGLPIIDTLCDQVDIRRQPAGGTRVTMHFRRGARPV